MEEKVLSREEKRIEEIREAARAKAKAVHDEYEAMIDDLKQRRLLVDRECGRQVKESNEAVTQNNAEIVRLSTMLEKAASKEIKLSFKEKSEMKKELKERRGNQEKLMYEAFDLQDEYKSVMQQITDEIKSLREQQTEKELRARYSGQYLKMTLENVLRRAFRPYTHKDIVDNHSELRYIDKQKIDLILSQMVKNGEVNETESVIGEKMYELINKGDASAFDDGRTTEELMLEASLKAAEQAAAAAVAAANAEPKQEGDLGFDDLDDSDLDNYDDDYDDDPDDYDDDDLDDEPEDEKDNGEKEEKTE